MAPPSRLAVLEAAGRDLDHEGEPRDVDVARAAGWPLLKALTFLDKALGMVIAGLPFCLDGAYAEESGRGHVASRLDDGTGRERLPNPIAFLELGALRSNLITTNCSARCSCVIAILSRPRVDQFADLGEKQVAHTPRAQPRPAPR